MKTAIHWFRRDLRITDNTALTACAQRASEVVCLYILSDWEKSHRWTGPHRQKFLCGCLESLAGNLAAIGGRLTIRRGRAVDVLAQLIKESRAEGIFFNRDPDPFGRRVEEEVFRLGREFGVEVADFKDVSVFERDEVLNGSGKPYRVFTPYAKAWRKQRRPGFSGRLRRLNSPTAMQSHDLPQPGTWEISAGDGGIEPGEKAARARLTDFLASGIADYETNRDRPAVAGTSRLSQDLRLGLLSIREVVERCGKKIESLPPSGRDSGDRFVSELIWREFYLSILWHFPEVLQDEFQLKFRGMNWPGTQEAFARWCEGETGFPLVDAAMRQLNQTGYMPNRARMITAMFLTKDLQVDWRWGEQYFMQKLTDGEIASNNGGWQWCAGTGADAAPYFRIQNPWTQTARHDPAGDYVRKWVPELKHLPAKRFFSPPPEGERLVSSYPFPMVNHAQARERTLEMFREAAGDG